MNRCWFRLSITSWWQLRAVVAIQRRALSLMRRTLLPKVSRRSNRLQPRIISHETKTVRKAG